MSDAPQLELSDEQREEVRAMLAKFSNKKEEEQRVLDVRSKVANESDPDPLETAKPGETVEWHELTPKTRRYSFVRETTSLFFPLILDKIPFTHEQLKLWIDNIGLRITSQNSSLTVCSIAQADPVRIFHIQTAPHEQGFIVETIRYIV